MFPLFQCKKLSQAIELGGGIAQVLSLKDNLSQVESVLLQPNTCVMNCDATDEDSSSISQSDWLARLFQIIQQYVDIAGNNLLASFLHFYYIFLTLL